MTPPHSLRERPSARQTSRRYAVVVTNVERYLTPSRRGHDLGKPGLTSPAKRAGLIIPHPCHTRRAGCLRDGACPCSMGARQSSGEHDVSPVILAFLPNCIQPMVLNEGDRDRPRKRGRRRSKRVSGEAANPVQGVRTRWVRSTWPAGGVLDLVTGELGLTGPARSDPPRRRAQP